jgi:hypothetical protein
MRYLRHPIKRLAKVAALSRVLLVVAIRCVSRLVKDRTPVFHGKVQSVGWPLAVEWDGALLDKSYLIKTHQQCLSRQSANPMGRAQATNESGPTLSCRAACSGIKATRVKNEGASPLADARTYRLEEGCDERRLMPL